MKRTILVGLFIFIILGIVWALDNLFIQTGDIYASNLIGNQMIPEGFARADGSHIWDFPTDFGPHPDYQTEWWYYTGNLQTVDGNRYGYQLTFFRRGLTPSQDIEDRDSSWGVNQVYMGHFALSDITNKQHYAFERFSRGAAGLAGAQAEPFQVWLENWEVSENQKGDLRLFAEQGEVRLDLLMNDQKGVFFHGYDGYSQKGPEPGNASYYFSQTRLASDGVIGIGDQLDYVKGISWMDHEFSTNALSPGQVGWDWFSIQLNDGKDLMVFQIRRADGSIDPYSSGTLISSNGESTYLSQDQFTIQENGTWRSPRSGATYPIQWTIQIPQIDLSLDIEPYMADQELNFSYIYWEGAVGVKGTYAGQEVTGSGYVELTGYAHSMEGEF